MPTATIDGIATRYEVHGSGPPLLMYAPGGFDATLEKWTTQGVYAKIKLLDHLPKQYTCIIFDRRECGQSGGRVEHVTWAHYVTAARHFALGTPSGGAEWKLLAWIVGILLVFIPLSIYSYKKRS